MPRLRHLLIQGTAQTQPYMSTVRGSGVFRTPPRDQRIVHGEHLAAEVRRAAEDLAQAPEKPAENIKFVPISVKSDPDFNLMLERLDNKTVQLVNVRKEPDGSEKATINVPVDKIPVFVKKFEDYAHKNSSSNKPANQDLVESITELRLAGLRNGDYWMDNTPWPAPREIFWWEIWLRDEGDVVLPDGQAVPVETAFREEAARLRIRVSTEQLKFPDYVVVLAFTSLTTLTQFPGLLGYLAELRRANIVTREFLNLPPAGQADFIQGMLERTTFAGENAPAVCILDCGVNRGHPLLEHALAEEHNLAWNDEWEADDRLGHGTEMAGLALYGPHLGDMLLTDKRIRLVHRLEAVKILPDDGENSPPDYGPITQGSVAKIEIEAPDRPRVICMAITAPDKDQYLPSLWSASLDQMCSGAYDEQRRLMFVSAGNYLHMTVADYPQANHNASVQDPAQAWNVITVGAFTQKVMITDPDLAGYQPLAPDGGLCPTSTTSCGWDKREWPFKPDIVMEGGNYAYDPHGDLTDPDELSLLTTRISRSGALLSMMKDTSAATALAARHAALIQSEYPTYWPETIRGLLIHSARWTPQMIEEFPYDARHQRLRCYGYGVPNLQIARECAQNRATMIIQDTLQPFCWDEDKKKTASFEMHEHTLPWPIEMLQELDGIELSMRVTLSYFIEPSPGRRAWTRRHRYQSFGLRFDVKRPEEDLLGFRRRLTRDAWEEDAPPGRGVSESRTWSLGDELRKKGSIHSDVWHGTGAQLAASGLIAIHPITGWWRERTTDKCYDKKARYSLIVTLESTEDIDIYGSIETVIANSAGVTVTI
jgi:Subtilase family